MVSDQSRGTAAFHWCRTVFYLIPVISVYTVILGIVSLGSTLLERRGYLAHRCARLWSWLILATTGVAVDVKGVEHLERGRTYVFVSNHQSIYDIPVVFAALPYQLRIIAKASLGAFPFLGWHLRRSGHLLVDRKHPDRRAILGRWRNLVSQGLSLIIFPEGTRSADGRVAPFKAGSFLLAIEAKLPVVPLSIEGTRLVMRKGGLTTCPGLASLTIHPPIETATLSVHDARTLAERTREIVTSARGLHRSSANDFKVRGCEGSKVRTVEGSNTAPGTPGSSPGTRFSPSRHVSRCKAP